MNKKQLVVKILSTFFAMNVQDELLSVRVKYILNGFFKVSAGNFCIIVK